MVNWVIIQCCSHRHRQQHSIDNRAQSKRDRQIENSENVAIYYSSSEETWQYNPTSLCNRCLLDHIHLFRILLTIRLRWKHYSYYYAKLVDTSPEQTLDHIHTQQWPPHPQQCRQLLRHRESGQTAMWLVGYNEYPDLSSPLDGQTQQIVHLGWNCGYICVLGCHNIPKSLIGEDPPVLIGCLTFVSWAQTGMSMVPWGMSAGSNIL